MFFICWACPRKVGWLNKLCLDCLENLPYVSYETSCPHCLLSQKTKNILYCADCNGGNLQDFEKLFAPFYYQGALPGLIQAFKFHKELGAGKLLSEFLLKFLKQHQVPGDYPELILPVPLHARRLRRRGFNQSYLVAKWIGKKLKIPVNFKILRRVRWTVPQVSLGREERLKNLKQVFQIQWPKNSAIPNHVALVDDVVTTGTTVNTLAKLLIQSGVKRVDVWCLAKAVLN